MKVVHVTTVHDPFDTRIFEKMCRSAVSAGCDVTLVATHPCAEQVDGVKIVPIRRRRNRLARASMGVREAVRIASQLDADIYHIHDPELLLGARRLSRRGVVVYDMHENVTAALKHKDWISPRLRPMFATVWTGIERILLGNLAVIYAELSYAKHYPWVRTFETVLNMPKLERLPQAGSQSGGDGVKKVVYLGTITEARGSIVNLQAAALLRSWNTDVELLCIGAVSEAHLQELHEHIERMGLTNVTFTGRLRSAEALNTVATCQVGLATILPYPNYVESYPTKLFEYMAMGVPVVASDFPLYRDIVETYDCGICVDPGDPKAVANAIRKLIEDPVGAVQMGARGRDAVYSAFHWEVEAKKLLGFYSRLVSAAQRN